MPAASGTPANSAAVWCDDMCALPREIQRGFAGGGTRWSRTARTCRRDRILRHEAVQEVRSILHSGDVESGNLNIPEQLLQRYCLEPGHVEDPLGYVLECACCMWHLYVAPPMLYPCGCGKPRSASDHMRGGRIVSVNSWRIPYLT